jgi:hypothetical protein
MTTIQSLPQEALPWRYALRIGAVDSDTFRRFIDALKAHIAQRNRKWDSENKCWLLRDCDVAIGLMNRFSIAYECEAAPEPERPGALTTVAAYRMLHLLPTAPEYVIVAAYRALARANHPDTGGDLVAMQTINRAMEVLGCK